MRPNGTEPGGAARNRFCATDNSRISDLHQCGLAGAVFAEYGVHLSGAAIDAEAIQRANAGIGLGYVFDTEHEIRHETTPWRRWG